MQLDQYSKLHLENTSTNNQISRMAGAICLVPEGNLHGVYNFYILLGTRSHKNLDYPPYAIIGNS